MQPLILHHYWGSPYAEKVRAAMGYKKLRWLSHEITVVPPRPALEPVLGGFRRTPVLQIGADYVCDTRLILRVLDKIAPEPPLEGAPQDAFAELLCGWAEPRVFALFGPVRFRTHEDIAGVLRGAVGGREFRDDRLPFMRPVYEAERVTKIVDSCRDHLRHYLNVIDMQLGAGQLYLAGSRPGFADFSAYHTVWWMRTAPALPEMFADFTRLSRWADRIVAFGHGDMATITGDETQAAARNGQGRNDAVSPGFPQRDDGRLGKMVEIVPDDYGRDPVSGRVVAVSDRHFTIEREAEGIGTVRVHFPSLGYEIVVA